MQRYSKITRDAGTYIIGSVHVHVSNILKKKCVRRQLMTHMRPAGKTASKKFVAHYWLVALVDTDENNEVTMK